MSEEKLNKESSLRLGFVLLDSKEIDWSVFYVSMKEEWDIEVTEQPNNDILMVSKGDMMAALSFMPAPIPGNEATENAKNNLFWKEAVAVTEKHQAQIMISVMGEGNAIEKSIYFTQLVSSALKMKNAIAIYFHPTVIEAEEYRSAANEIHEGRLPISNWIYFGFYQDEGKISAYTNGLDYFNKLEIEVIKTEKDLAELADMLFGIACYVVESNVELQNGETIGMSAEQKLSITLSEGVATEKESLKIGF